MHVKGLLFLVGVVCHISPPDVWMDWSNLVVVMSGFSCRDEAGDDNDGVDLSSSRLISSCSALSSEALHSSISLKVSPPS